MLVHYTLADGIPVPCADPVEWVRWYIDADRQLEHTQIEGASISTVFLGLDVGMGGQPPVLWETMVSGGEFDGRKWRYTSASKAGKGHTQVVEALQDLQGV